MYIAHVKETPDGWEEHSLQEHLLETAKLAKKFASKFNSEDWVETAALWHDLGKYLPTWQSYIRRKTGYEPDAHIESKKKGRPNHSTAGAVLALKRFREIITKHDQADIIARVLAYIISGHHAGLPDWYQDMAGGELTGRIFNSEGKLDTVEIDEVKQLHDTEQFFSSALPRSQPSGSSKSKNNNETMHLWIRMLFSCLVDADFLDTERFMDGEKYLNRGNYKDLSQLKKRFDVFIQKKIETSSVTPVNQKRREILEACRTKSRKNPGFFSLNVPTGGGKTFSAMAFALEHAVIHGKDRIIMVIPYTSIIEQTARVYKYGTDIEEEITNGAVLFGEDNVLEHHSNVDPDQENHKSRLASENWDAPVIVTTNVQLFESLFASRTSQCRKLHSIANSVLILDEVQLLPPEYLKPVISVLKALVDDFGCTVVLSTATQPALTGNIGTMINSFQGITAITHIIDKPEELAQSFKRVDILKPHDEIPVEWVDLAFQLQQEEQVLCIVNSRKDCRELHNLMPVETIHLSALMCGEERSEVISLIKEQLRNSEPVRVISTQLVEAGVDMDFPVVYRAMTGLDSIAQAAGRCNREGIRDSGRVVLFNPPTPSPRGLLRKAEDSAKTVLRQHEIIELEPELFTSYFQHFYGSVNTFDKPDFFTKLVKESAFLKFQFRTFAQYFRLIDNNQYRGVYVYYEGKKNSSLPLIKELQEWGPSRRLMRKLQRFTVNVPVYYLKDLVENGSIIEKDGYYIQGNDSLYAPGLGLQYDTEWEGESFVI